MSRGLQPTTASVIRPGRRGSEWLAQFPPQAFFLVSAVFHYLGPSFAVLLFARVEVLGVAWLRIVTAAAVFSVWRRPWRLVLRLEAISRRVTHAIDQLGASMLIAAVAITPLGLGRALPAFTDPTLLLAGAAVGVCSSVIPYVIDQLAMARLPRASFALMLALLPMFATLIGAVVLRQIPTLQELAGVTLVMAGVALHQVSPNERTRECTT